MTPGVFRAFHLLYKGGCSHYSQQHDIEKSKHPSHITNLKPQISNLKPQTILYRPQEFHHGVAVGFRQIEEFLRAGVCV